MKNIWLNKYGKQLHPSERLTEEDYKRYKRGHGLKCCKCNYYVNQDATVSPGVCLMCYLQP